MTLTDSIKQKAVDLGFDLVGITTADPIGPQHIRHFKDWLKSHYAAQMNYMYHNLDKRTNPAKLLAGARSVICVGLNYKPPISPPQPQAGCFARIANFALYEDYHHFIKGRLRLLIDFIKTASANDELKFKICVDSVPLAERSLAQRAGLGFIGRNHMLINPQLGLQILLGQIVTDLELQADTPMNGQCSGCDKCIKACPTGALRIDGTFDAAKCISYLTIEHTGQSPQSLEEKIGVNLFGCDNCILACPYENDAPPKANSQFEISPNKQWMDLERILQWDSKEFHKHFSHSTVQRPGLEKLKRNARVCLKNIRSNHGARKMSPPSPGTSVPE